LVPLTHVRERLGDLSPDLTADSLIDLVEHQRRNPILAGERQREPEHQPRELAARCRLGQRPRLEAFVELNEKLDSLGTTRPDRRDRFEPDGESTARQTELRE